MIRISPYSSACRRIETEISFMLFRRAWCDRKLRYGKANTSALLNATGQHERTLDTGHWTLRLAKRKDDRQEAGYGLEEKWKQYLEAWHLLERLSGDSQDDTGA